MTDADGGNDDPVIRERGGRIGLRLDPESGLPSAVLFRQGATEVALPLTLTAALEVGGREVPRAPRGLEYVDTELLTAFRRRDATLRRLDNGPAETYAVSTEVGGWAVDWEYTFQQRHPRIELNVVVAPPPDEAQATLRDLRLDLCFGPDDLGEWLVEAPGNALRPGVAADALDDPIAVSTAGGLRGSTGLVALHHPGRSQVLVVWPFCRTEIGALHLQSRDGGVWLTIVTGLAGRPASVRALRYGAIGIDAIKGTWADVRDRIPDWYAGLGLSTPHDRPEWVEAASIFEVQIGFSVFHGGYRYAPYPTVRDLLADLGRIRGLGYDCLQIMPRQPYPSYNVHDYADVMTSYGDETDLRALVAACHALGMRVILDILLHGLIDQEVMAQTAERVRSGPYFARLAEGTVDPFGAGSSAREAMHVAWSRHILDFERYWSEGSPPRHPLADEHPEWFMRDSDQRIIGIYTKAFDVANAEWQEYFVAAAEALVRRLDVDGFRFDAPTYNDLPNWSTATEHRASYSPLGCLLLFDRLRERLERVKESTILYTEPSGVLFRQSMDVTYNYDEQWLIGAVLRPSADDRERRTAVRHGRDLAAWFRDRNAILPRGSLIAHHIDSHDTFWWPLPGQKWRREQHGVAATRALLAVFALSGGAYMTFVGGEREIEEDVRRVHRLRRTLPEIGHGAARYDAIAVDHDAVYGVVRQLGGDCSVLLVNLSNAPLEAAVSLDTSGLGLGDGPYELHDAWNDRTIDLGFRYAGEGTELGDLRLTFEAFQPRLLVARAAGAV